MNCGVRTGNRYIAGPHSLLARVTQFLPTRVYLESIFGGLKGAPDNSHLVPAPLTSRFPPTRYLSDVPRTLSELEFVFLMLESVVGNWFFLRNCPSVWFYLDSLTRFYWSSLANEYPLLFGFFSFSEFEA